MKITGTQAIKVAAATGRLLKYADDAREVSVEEAREMSEALIWIESENPAWCAANEPAIEAWTCLAARL
jgi:hypothetical protein